MKVRFSVNRPGDGTVAVNVLLMPELHLVGTLKFRTEEEWVQCQRAMSRIKPPPTESEQLKEAGKAFGDVGKDKRISAEGLGDLFGGLFGK